MTIWKMGMHACVVNNRWRYENGEAVLDPPEIGDVFVVHGVRMSRPSIGPILKRLFGKRWLSLRVGEYGWVAAVFFRPVAQDDVKLIAKIKACKPIHEPLSTGLLPTHAPVGHPRANVPTSAGVETVSPTADGEEFPSLILSPADSRGRCEAGPPEGASALRGSGRDSRANGPELGTHDGRN